MVKSKCLREQKMLWMNRERLLEGYKYEKAKQMIIAGNAEEAIPLIVNAASWGHVQSMVELGDILTANKGSDAYYPYCYEDGLDWYKLAASCNDEKAIGRIGNITGKRFVPKQIYREYQLAQLASSSLLILLVLAFFIMKMDLLASLVVLFTMKNIIDGFYVLNNLFELGNMRSPKHVTDPYKVYVSHNNSTIVGIGIGLAASMPCSMLLFATAASSFLWPTILRLFLLWIGIITVLVLLYLLVLIKRKASVTNTKFVKLLTGIGLIEHSKWSKRSQNIIQISVIIVILFCFLILII